MAGGVGPLGGESGRKGRRATEPEESGGGSSLERELTTKKGKKFGELVEWEIWLIFRLNSDMNL